MSLRSTYVSGVRGVREGLRRTGALAPVDRWAERSRTGTWARSLLAVYDLDDLAALGVPWWTFESADLVDEFLRWTPAARVVEWGSGASTLWLSQRASRIVSVEHDAAWAAHMAELLPANVDLRLVPATEPRAGRRPVLSFKAGWTGLDFGDYVDAIDDVDGPIDLVIVDGRARDACLARAIERVRPGGIVLVDNVERGRNRDAVEQASDLADVTWTWGLTPCLPYPTGTAVLRRRTST